MKPNIPGILAIVYIAGLATAAGCSGRTSESAGGMSGGGAPPPERPPLRIFMSDQALIVPERIDEFERYIGERAGVPFDIAYLPHAQYMSQVHLRLASGEAPDAYQSWSVPDEDLISTGKVLRLNELIEQHGKHLQDVIPQDAWSAVTIDGSIYAIPQPAVTLQGSVMYIRKDWLDRLGLAVPRTSEELLEVMRAFRDRDPNGNGVADEIPFISRERMEWMDNIFGMWGVNSRYAESYHDGELLLGSVHPRFLRGLDYLRTMYAEKLLDQEFLMNTLSIWDQKIQSGSVGIWNHSPRSAWRWQQALEASVPEQRPEVVVIPTPQGSGFTGSVGTKWSPIANTFIITRDAADPASIVKLLDWLCSAEGRAFIEGGLTADGDPFESASGDGATPEMQFLQKQLALHGVGPEAEAAAANDPRAYEKLKVAFHIANAQGFRNEMVGMPAIGNDYNLHELYIEAAALVIVGEKPLESYEVFVEEWKANGGKQFIDERTAWYREHRLRSP